MAITAIKTNLLDLIEEYERGIDDPFMRGYVRGSIETFGELICFSYIKADEPFYDYIMRLKKYLNTEFDVKGGTLFSCHF